MARDTESPEGRVWGPPLTRPAHSCLRRVLQKPWGRGRGCDRCVECAGQGLLLLTAKPSNCHPGAPRSCQVGLMPHPRVLMWSITSALASPQLSQLPFLNKFSLSRNSLC